MSTARGSSSWSATAKRVRTSSGRCARSPGGVFLLGGVPRAALAGIYAACDLFVWPAINEAFGMALLEAQSCGLPAVAGAWGGVAAILVDGKTGWLAKPGDAGAFSADIDFALDANLWAFSQAARDNALRKHDIGTAAAILVRGIAKAARR